MAAYLSAMATSSLMTLFGIMLVWPGASSATTTLSSVAVERDLRVGAFNVQLFGLAVMRNQDIVDVLKQIIVRYDIVLIQEIRDKSETAIKDLLQQINEITDDSYRMNVSDRLGRTNSKEQYAFLYKKDRVEVIDAYHYDDGPECTDCPEPTDQFQREPYVVLFQSSSLEKLEKFALVPIHTQPTDAVREIDFLSEVYEDVTARWNVYDMMILGDFNAGCSYVGRSDWDNIRLWTGQVPEGPYEWLISHGVDTTVSEGFCAYDRIVATGELLNKAVVPLSATAYYFDKELGVNETFTPQVSDHFPVEVLLKGKVNDNVKANIAVIDSFTVSDIREISNIKYIRAIYLASIDQERAYFSVKRCYKSSGGNLEVKANRIVQNREDVIGALKEFDRKIPFVLSSEVLQVIDHKMAAGSLMNMYTHPADELEGNFVNSGNNKIGYYEIEIECPLVSPYLCQISVKTHAGLE